MNAEQLATIRLISAIFFVLGSSFYFISAFGDYVNLKYNSHQVPPI